jgi:hypothetical protein
MKSTILLILLLSFNLSFAGTSHPHYGGGHHTTSHGGHYSGGSSGSSHKGGHYTNTKTNNTYGTHKK